MSFRKKEPFFIRLLCRYIKQVAKKLLAVLAISSITPNLFSQSLPATLPAVTITTHGVADTMVIVNFADILRLPPDTVHRQRPEDENDESPYPFPMPIGAVIIRDTNPTPSTQPGGHQAQSPAPTSNFTGVTENGAIPSDIQCAAGPSNIVVAANDHITIMSKTGTISSSVSPSTWFTSLTPSFPFDPRIRYDPYSQRWIMVYADHADATTSCLYVCVSATNSPTGTWYFYKMTADATGVTWMDYPCMGFNKSWIVVTGNMFTVSGGSFSTGKVWVFDKANMYAHGTGSFTNFTNGNIFALEPATTYDANESSEFMMQDWNGGSSADGLWHISGAVGSEALSSQSFVVGSTAWSDGPSSDDGPQLGSTNKLNLGDSRMQSVVFRGNYLWFAQTVFFPSTTPTRASIQWWEIDTLGNTQQHALIDDATGTNFYAYPSLVVNSYNDALIGYSNLSSTEYASANYSFRYACDATSTMESTYQYKAGQNSYYYDDGTGRNRWGDYSGTVVDPTDDISMWTIQNVAASTVNIWTSWLAEVVPTHSNGGAGTWTWTGGRSTSWFDPCNWDKGTLPDGSSDVIIPSGTTYAPTITGAAGSCNTVSITTGSGGILNIDDAGGGSLNITQ